MATKISARQKERHESDMAAFAAMYPEFVKKPGAEQKKKEAPKKPTAAKKK